MDNPIFNNISMVIAAIAEKTRVPLNDDGMLSSFPRIEPEVLFAAVNAAQPIEDLNNPAFTYFRETSEEMFAEMDWRLDHILGGWVLDLASRHQGDPEIEQATRALYDRLERAKKILTAQTIRPQDENGARA